MAECAVRIGEEGWEQWLRCVADTKKLRSVEVSAALVEAARSPALDLIEHLGLSVLHVPDAIPVNVSRFFAESTFPNTMAALQALRQGVAWRLRSGTRIASVDLGLDRIESQGVQQGLRQRIALLEAILSEIDSMDIALALRVRMPRPFPRSHEWEWAGNIVHELGRHRCSLVLDVVLGDADGRLVPDDLVRSCASQLSLVRFLYSHSVWERPPDAVHAGWAQALHRHAAGAAVVFCPQSCGVGQVQAAIEDIDRWQGFYLA